MSAQLLQRHLVSDLINRHMLFLLTVDNQIYSGIRQILADPATRTAKYSLIHHDMLLGRYHSFCHHENGVSAYYWTLTDEQKAIVLQAAIKNPLSTLIFPYTFMDEDQKELVSPPEYWNVGEADVNYLDTGEEYLRAYTADILRQLDLPPNSIVYDPACSTGRLLASIQDAHPQLRVVGADISSHMVAIASHHIKEVSCLNPADLINGARKCNVLILRFLNSEVMKREEAEDYFVKFAEALQQGAYVFMFGYTAILINVLYMASRCGLEIERAIGYCDDHIFEYYVLRKAPHTGLSAQL